MNESVEWSESENRSVVTEYFKLLKAETGGYASNKAAVYRDLSRQFPRRSMKAFERKFQNISAILYELSLPYCSGLKPLSNYQKMLRLIVLDFLEKSPLPSIPPHLILASKLRELRLEGAIPVVKKGAGRFGLAIEDALGISQNSSKSPDFMEIELKTKSDSSLQTLFSRVPSRYSGGHDKKSMFEKYGYFDNDRKRRALYTSFNNQPDSLGFYLKIADQMIRICKGNTIVLEYDAETIGSALSKKHSQTVFITVLRKLEGNSESCIIASARFCQRPSVSQFFRLIASGDIYLDFTISESKEGKIKDHGFLWRIKNEAVENLYEQSSQLDV